MYLKPIFACFRIKSEVWANIILLSGEVLRGESYLDNRNVSRGRVKPGHVRCIKAFPGYQILSCPAEYGDNLSFYLKSLSFSSF